MSSAANGTPNFGAIDRRSIVDPSRSINRDGARLWPLDFFVGE
jgi:hypothetical protein